MAITQIIGAEITLTAIEQIIAQDIARRRYDSNRREGVTNNRIGPQSDESTDLEGFASELAYCKLFNVYPDFSVSTRRGGHDCEHLGIRIDVKGTQYRHGHLLAVIGKQRGEVDVYALMIGKFPTYRFAGCAGASELLVTSRIADMGHGDTYSIEQSALSSYCYKHGPYAGSGVNCPHCDDEELEF